MQKTWQKIKMDPEILDQYLVREKVVDQIRQFFKSSGYHEVFTPILVPVPSAEPNLESFETELRTSKGEKRRGFLIMSPEFAIKKLLAAGVGNCFEITHCFRNNEEASPLHNPEFTMLEWYHVGADYKDVMVETETLFTQILGEKLTYQGENYDLSLPWPRISVAEAFEGKIPAEADFSQAFFNDVEPKLRASGKPAIVYDYPAYQASLAKMNSAGFAERFEVFLAGIELGNCFSELLDPVEQEARFKNELKGRDYGLDTDFIAALKSGMPPTSGIAVGIDRLVMLAADVPTVADTLFFPGKELFDL